MDTKVCTKTHEIEIDKLKGLKGLERISFDGQPLTGIFGPNGIGKSTILHALAAAYRPSQKEFFDNNHYNQFFPKIKEDVWNGTKFTITHSGKVNNSVSFERGTEEYQKGTSTTLWKPVVTRRPIREVAIVGIRSCMPSLEMYNSHNLVGAVETELTDDNTKIIVKAASDILKRKYTSLYEVSAPEHPSRKYIALGCDGHDSPYPSVTMGAGEQRLLSLLLTIVSTKKHALILIDELDLLLHGDALCRLIDWMHSHAKKKGNLKQIVFTSHREELLTCDKKINIRHLHFQNGRHFCFADTDSDSLYRLTGKRERKLELFVEDALAEAVVRYEIDQCGLSKYTSVNRFGDAANCFRVLAGLLVKGEKCKNTLFVLDGDVYLKEGERNGRITDAFSGTDSEAHRIRDIMQNTIIDLALPDGEHDDQNPEKYINSLICSLEVESLSTAEEQIKVIAESITAPINKHEFVDEIMDELGGSRESRITQIVAVAAKHDDWAAYTKPVREWLEAKKAELNLT